MAKFATTAQEIPKLLGQVWQHYMLIEKLRLFIVLFQPYSDVQDNIKTKYHIVLYIYKIYSYIAGN